MPCDLLITNGAPIDGSDLARYRAGVAVSSGRIVAIGETRDSACETIDAEGRVVGASFTDGHTHMDVQIFWDPLGACASLDNDG